MHGDRYSSPPDPVKLEKSTAGLTASLDRLERSVGHLPTPVALVVATVEVSDAQRLAVVREIWAAMKHGGGNPHADLCRYEDAVKARLRE